MIMELMFLFLCLVSVTVAAGSVPENGRPILVADGSVFLIFVNYSFKW
jgi:hypothetical protein